MASRFPYWFVQYAFGTVAHSSFTFCRRVFRNPPVLSRSSTFTIRGTEAPEERLVGAGDIGVDHRDEPQADQVSEGGESGGEVPRGGLDHCCLCADLTSLGRLPEDPVGGAVLDASDRVDILEFGKQIHSLHCQRHLWRGA